MIGSIVLTVDFEYRNINRPKGTIILRRKANEISIWRVSDKKK
jgi:hypothetical protein